jgi:hypothetical protein
MSETRAWGSEGVLLLDLQEKFHSYLDFVEQGQLLKKFPDLAGKKIRIRLDTTEKPSDTELDFLKRAKSEWLKPLGISLEWGLFQSKETHENT